MSNAPINITENSPNTKNHCIAGINTSSENDFRDFLIEKERL